MNRSKLYAYSDGSQFSGKSAEAIFTEIGKENFWTGDESVSGLGSALLQTKTIIRVIPKIIQELNIKTIFDIPCGDFNWFQKIDLTDVVYLGGDIVKDIILRNNQRYQRRYRHFIHFNLLEEIPTLVDLIFCRDCLVHFSLADIFKALSNIQKSGAEYLMTTTFPEENVNADIVTGGWRPLNFEKAPFCFPEPEIMVNEKCSEMSGVFKDKSLGVWKISELMQV